MFASFPWLETPRLILRHLKPADAPAIFHLFADPEVTRYYDMDTFTDVAQAVQLIERIAERFRQKASIRWGLARKEDDLIIGTVGIFPQPHWRASIGYDLARPYWRRGVMNEALVRVIDFGFAQMDVNRIEALVMPGNIASANLLLKLGFQEEGTLREYMFFKGQFQDLQSFSILKKEYRRET